MSRIMQDKRIVTICVAVLTLFCTLCGCQHGDEVLTVCHDIVALHEVSFEEIKTSDRPKVISNISQRRFERLEVPLLRKQVMANPEFDFLFYIAGAGQDYREKVVRFLQESQLPIIVFLDKENKFRKANNVPSKCSYATSITDAKLRRVGVAMPGFHLSPFDTVMSEARKQLGLK